ncbi:MAG: hypothetical protein KAR64_00465 [Thermoplasmatales archaeon]|nr:hypothetical protein [Thermoplasmatales archaeon]
MTKNKGKSLHGCKVVFVTLTLIMLSLSAFAGTESEIGNNQVLTVTYSFDVPYVEKLAINHNIYDKVILPGAPSIADPGEPCLPVKGAYILIPKNTQVSKIDVIPSEKVYLGSGFNIEPSGKPVPLSMASLAKPPEADPEIYDSNDPFPGVLFTEVDTYSFRGYDVLVLSLYPVQYVPVKGEIFYFNNITVSVELVEDKNTNSLFRGLMNDKLEIIKKVDNPAIVDTYIKKITACPVLGQYDFLILTTDEFKNSFEPLKNAHDAEGIKTEIKTLRDISLFPDSVTPEDIRDFIKDEYLNNGIEYVLLGGDADAVLAKMLYVFGLDEETWSYETEMPSDLYYACLDGPYNFDGDDRWGEPTDGEGGSDVDLFAEVYVGRACVDSKEDVNNFVSKTISYMNTDVDDDYLNEVLMVGEYLGDYGIASWGGNYLDLLIDRSTIDGYTTVGIPSSDYTINTLYDRDWPDDTGWPKEEIIDRVNNGIHIINHDGHSSYGYNMRMINDNIGAFTNEQYCFVYSVGCMSGGFDDPNGYDCFAEYLTVKTEHGAFAAIMNARYGWFWAYRTDGDGTRYTREFWDAIFNENMPVISKANQDSKEDNLYLIERSCMRWTFYQLNLFGDPVIAFHIGHPPDKPAKPSGPTSGKSGQDYVYSTNTTDPDDDQILYLFDWGDGSTSDWLGPYGSGEICETSHRWDKKGTYLIKVKARDKRGIEGPWSDPLSLSLPKDKAINSLLFRFLENHPRMFPILRYILV